MPEEEPPSSSGGTSGGSVGVERGVVNPKSRSCRGCLFYSSYLRDTNQNPTCYGFSRSIPHSYRALEEREATKDFKYACLGYGVHKEINPSAISRLPPEGNGELPLCVGIEFLADRRPISHHPHHRHHHHHKHKEDPESPPVSSPLSRQEATTVGANPPSEDFSTRWLRSAGLVATGVVNNVIRVAGSAKDTVDSMFSSEKGKPK